RARAAPAAARIETARAAPPARRSLPRGCAPDRSRPTFRMREAPRGLRELPPRVVQPRVNRPHGNAGDGRDLRAAQLLDLVHHDHRPMLGIERVEQPLEPRLLVTLVQALVGAGQRRVPGRRRAYARRLELELEPLRPLAPAESAAAVP